MTTNLKTIIVYYNWSTRIYVYFYIEDGTTEYYYQTLLRKYLEKEDSYV